MTFKAEQPRVMLSSRLLNRGKLSFSLCVSLLTVVFSSLYFVLQANFIAPGKRPLSSCVPTVVLHEEVTVLIA